MHGYWNYFLWPGFLLIYNYKGNFMKKLLLAAAATAAFSSSAMADDSFYLRADAGLNMFNKFKVDGDKFKTKVSPSMEIGVGYGVMDNVRAELAYGYHFNPTAKNTTDGVTTKVKSNIQTLMVKGFYDAFDLGMAKVFVGTGVGLSKTSAKVSETGEDSAKIKSKNNFTYMFALGTSFDVADSVKIDVQYNFQDFGTLKSTNGVKGPKLRANTIKLGARFAL